MFQALSRFEENHQVDLAANAVYEQWRARGAEFLTPPTDRGAELRCYLRDPDGHLIEVGQATVTPAQGSPG